MASPMIYRQLEPNVVMDVVYYAQVLDNTFAYANGCLNNLSSSMDEMLYCLGISYSGTHSFILTVRLVEKAYDALSALYANLVLIDAPMKMISEVVEIMATRISVLEQLKLDIGE